MRRFALRTRVAAVSAASACALIAVSPAAADGPVFAIVGDDTSGTTAPVGFTPGISFDSLAVLTGSDVTAAAALAREPLGSQAVSIALRHIGVPYVWGGASSEGFDCSGFAMYVYGLLGIRLPHYTGHQIKVGYPVAFNQLQAGDLLFFNPGANGDPGHEGIYVGRGLMVQAPQRGDYVRVSVLDASRMASYMGAVRPY